MLGDDDALGPDMLIKMDRLASEYSDPDCLYVMAYHYAYPGVFVDQPSGYLCKVSNSPLFEAELPYMLDAVLARQHAVNGLRLHHSVSFNAQHFIWRRDFIKTGPQPFFQSPYPDYFACFTTMASGGRILVIPSAEVLIGISKNSFGFYFANSREDEGVAQFLASDVDIGSVSSGIDGANEALEFPGSHHYRSWLIASLLARKYLGLIDNCAESFDRYKTIQLYGIAFEAGYSRKIDSTKLAKIGKMLKKRERARLAAMVRGFVSLRLSKIATASLASYGISAALSIHAAPKIYPQNLIDHSNIMDAYNFVHEQKLADTTERTVQLLDPRDRHIEKLTKLLNETISRADRVAPLEQILADKDAHIDKLTALLIESRSCADRVPSLLEGLADKDAHIDKLTALLLAEYGRTDRTTGSD